MQLHTLPKVTTNQKRRVGRGHGSGRSKTSGRGTKGQKARRSIPLHFEGGALPLTKRLPFLRGKGRNVALSTKPVPVNLDALNVLSAGSEVTLESLIKNNIVDDRAQIYGVKILGRGEINQKLTIKVATSASAKEKIEKAGGTVV